jgi:manganese/iron transport system ATP-binding protein
MSGFVTAPDRSPGSGVLLKMRGAAFGYGRRVVVSDVDLEVAAGDVLGIVGPNGAGKTTLIRGMLGLIPALAGRVERAERSIGYVPQRARLDALFPLRVEEVVHQGAYGRLHGWRRLQRADRDEALACLQRVGLVARAKEPFASLSGGQRQRVLIARALLARPRLLLLDEPTSGVDSGAQARVLELLERLTRDEGLAVLLVSHQIAMLRDAVDEVLWVAGGRVRRGPARELLAPAALEQLFTPGAAAGA